MNESEITDISNDIGNTAYKWGTQMFRRISY
jgi:hypothetical protein